ncbi:MAG: fructosamine kinase family protein [Azospirillaceae bacterium]
MTQTSDGALARRIATLTDRPVVRLTPLSGGSTVAVLRCDFADGGAPLAVKTAGRGPGDGDLGIEAAMLRDLGREPGFPAPAVVHAAPDLLLLGWCENEGGAPGPDGQRHLAALVADLHARPRPRFGYAYDTVIGRLHQPNPEGHCWLDFFRDQRLLHMTAEGLREGSVASDLARRLEALAGRLDRWLDEPAHPALLHGDLWTGNVCHAGGRVTGLIDPAIYHGHPEIELAFMTLFGTVTRDFFEAYRERLPLDRGFFEIRRDLYNIYPLLVHVRYWDRSYARPIVALLDRLGL